MGFLPQINEILGYLPESRQTLLFSATLPSAIRRMAETRLKNPEFITLSGDHVGALEIRHFVYLSRGDKLGELVQVVESENPESAVIFCNTRDETKRVAGALIQQGYSADWLNADLGQSEREKVMARTRRGDLRFLVATDVAARGIDISHLTHVINFDLPETAESYVHRTGRTGRAGRTGTALSLIEPSDIGNLYLLRLTYKIRPIERQLPSARELKTRAETDVVQMFVDFFGARRTHPDDASLARRLMTHEQAERVIAGLLRDHLGARPEAQEVATAARRARPATPVEPPSGRASPAEVRPARGPAPLADTGSVTSPGVPGAVTDVEPGASAETASDEISAPEAAPLPAAQGDTGNGQTTARRTLREGMAEIYVNLGRRDGITPDQIRRRLEEAGLGPEATDYVNVRHRHSFVAVKKELLDRALESLNGATLAGKAALAEPSRSRTPQTD
jgi:ATP-dependent RNA helicase DeaD